MKRNETVELYEAKGKIAVVMVSVFLICILIYFLKLFFVDGVYILSDRYGYESTYRQKIDSISIKSIVKTKNGLSIVYDKRNLFEGFGGFENDDDFYVDISMNTNSEESIKTKVSTLKLKQGDILFKNRNSNIFYVLKDGKKYDFKVDGNRNDNGELEKIVWPLERIKNILGKQ
ncbi:hypothetical protein [Ochrovirga pacifica]|uniref:hypothetical protein n=1 Tax=Ochrovirga pacifica TaxID=1042376 RepID=UPI000255A063|nr:hypothetical protein [Ochrovirga pacifica]